MNQAQASVKTPTPSRYLQRMCKHFAHKVPSDWNEAKGRIDFAMGSCWLAANDDRLDVHCKADSQEDLQEVLDTVKSHFERFAHQEQLTLQWN